MKTILTAAMLAAFLPALSASAAPPVPDADAAHSAAAPAQPDPAVLAQLEQVARDGRFGRMLASARSSSRVADGARTRASSMGVIMAAGDL